MRLDAALTDATRKLEKVSESARLDAELLLCRTIDMPRSYLFAHPDDELDDLARGRFEALLDRRADNVPIAYLLGTREFWSRELIVSPATLVPRPETERLVEIALLDFPEDGAWRVLDLGTGSGAIAIAIAAERPLCEVTATDVSPEAIAVARENVREAGLANVTCLTGSWTEPVAGQEFDLVLSNPPYIASDDPTLADLSHEPRIALVSGPDGLDDIRALSVACRSVLATGGRLILEHGADQRDQVAEILEANGWSEIACHNDLAGLPRVTVARQNGK